MALGWYLRRLRAMSPPEVAHRLVEKARKVAARGRQEGWERYPAVAIAPLPHFRQRLLAAPAELAGAVRTAARAQLDGEFAALGVRWPRRRRPHLFPESVWRLDPVSGQSWPGAETYCFDIPYRHETRLGDVKYLWEINRLQFLQPLAAHVALEDDAEALAALEQAIVSWYRANPPYRGLAWTSGIELALRAISLIVVVSLADDRLSPDVRTLIGSMLHAHAHWLERYPSRYSSANNHLIAELAAQYLIAKAAPDLAGSAGRGARARAGLIEETGRQLLSDGVPAEQSPSYGAFTAELILLAATVAEACGEPFPPAAAARLGDFARFIEWLADPSGAVPAIGDDDEGRVLSLCQAETAYPASVARAVAARLGRPTSLPGATDWRGILLGGTPAIGAAPTGLKTFAAGGYSVFRGAVGGRTLTATFDHGPLGYLSIAAHGHADALAVTLAIDGHPILVDPGTYLYHSGREWRDWFRGTSAHNTLNIAAADQSEIAGPFNWSRKANARFVDGREGPDWSVRAQHDGYLGRFGVIHERQLAGTPEELLISDRLLGRQGQRAEVVFQLAPGLTAELVRKTVVVCRQGLPVLHLEFDAGRIDIGAGPAGGWVSPAFGEKLPAPRIAWSGQVDAVGRVVRLRLPAHGQGSAGHAHSQEVVG